MRKHFVLAFVGAAMLSGAVLAQEPVPERRVFAVSVIDREGKPVRGLTADNFRGKFRRQQVKIISAYPDVSPRRIAVLVDTSGSMKMYGRWRLAYPRLLVPLSEAAPVN